MKGDRPKHKEEKQFIADTTPMGLVGIASVAPQPLEPCVI